MDVPLFSHATSGTDVCTVRKLSNLEYAEDVEQMSEDQRKFHAFLDHLNCAVTMFDVRFVHLNCKMLSRESIASLPNFFLTREESGGQVDLIAWVVVSHQVVVYKMTFSPFIHKVWLTFTKLKHLWRRCDIWSSSVG